MKALLFTASLVLAFPAAGAPISPIAPQQAAANVGACMTVEGRASMFQDSQRFGVDIDLGESGGNNAPVFMAFVPTPAGLPGLQSLDGQTVDITGVVLLDRGRPEIVLTNPDQIMTAGTDPGRLLTCDHD